MLICMYVEVCTVCVRVCVCAVELVTYRTPVFLPLDLAVLGFPRSNQSREHVLLGYHMFIQIK